MLSEAEANHVEQIGFILDKLHCRTVRDWTAAVAMTDQRKHKTTEADHDGVSS